MKRLSAPQYETHATFKEVAAPATPAAGYSTVYVKADGRVYLKDEAGVEYILTPGVGTSKLTVGTVAPTSPATGDLWVDTN